MNFQHILQLESHSTFRQTLFDTQASPPNVAFIVWYDIKQKIFKLSILFGEDNFDDQYILIYYNNKLINSYYKYIR